MEIPIETINKLFLELAAVATVKTPKEEALESVISGAAAACFNIYAKANSADAERSAVEVLADCSVDLCHLHDMLRD